MSWNYLWSEPTPQGYRVFSVGETKRLEDAFLKGEASIDVGGITKFLPERTTLVNYPNCPVYQSGDRALTRYLCGYYYANTASMFGPCHFSVCNGLEGCLRAIGSTQPYTDGERDYSIQEMTQTNRESRRKRPLIRIEGFEGVSKVPLGLWYYSAPSGVLTGLSYDQNEGLENAYTGVLTTSHNYKVEDKTTQPPTGSFHDPRSNTRIICQRYTIRFMAFTESNQLEALDPVTSDKLEAFLRENGNPDTRFSPPEPDTRQYITFDDGRYVYDFVKWQRTESSTGSVRRFLRIVVRPISTNPGPSRFEDAAPTRQFPSPYLRDNTGAFPRQDPLPPTPPPNGATSAAPGTGYTTPTTTPPTQVPLPTPASIPTPAVRQRVQVLEPTTPVQAKQLKIATSKITNIDDCSLLFAEGHVGNMQRLYLCSVLLHDFPNVEYIYGPCVRQMFLDSKPSAPSVFHCYSKSTCAQFMAVCDTFEVIEKEKGMKFNWKGTDMKARTNTLTFGPDDSSSIQIIVYCHPSEAPPLPTDKPHDCGCLRKDTHGVTSMDEKQVPISDLGPRLDN